MPTASSSVRPAYQHAVVIGGGVAGLVAARVVADHFEKVTLIERDHLPDNSDPRKGVPQGRHFHGLLKRGENILNELFPDLVSGLLGAGAVKVNLVSDLAWFHFGGWKQRSNLGSVENVCMTRPLLERALRRRVKALPNVALLDGMDVVGLLPSSDRRSVQGVTCRRIGGSADETLSADLVVNAGGRGSRLPGWLEAMGRPKVKESALQVDVGYASRIYKAPPAGKHPWKMLFVNGANPNLRMGALAPIENDQWIVVQMGTLGEYPPTDEAGFLEFSRSLPVPDFYMAVRELEPVGDLAGYKYPSFLRHHYEAMPDFPDGLAVLGDSHCSFNPIYGQGMTAGALGAQLLGEHLKAAGASGPGQLPVGFSSNFQRALAKSSNESWTVSTTEDMRNPNVSGNRPLGTGFVLWYTKRVQQLTITDPAVAFTFYQVMNMLAPVSELMKLPMLFKVLKGAPNSPAGAQASAPGASR